MEESAEIKRQNKRNLIGENFFEKGITSLAKSYVFGAIVGAGSISTDGILKIQINESDKDVVEKILDLTKWDINIPTKANSNGKLLLSTKVIAVLESLEKLGISSGDKQDASKLPQYIFNHEGLFRMFFIGLLETKHGRCLTLNKNGKEWSLTLTFSEPFLDLLNKGFLKFYGKSFAKKRKLTAYHFTIKDINELSSLLVWLYNTGGLDDFCSEGMKEKYEKIYNTAQDQ